MITPRFDCEQDDLSVTVRVRVPHARPRDFDIAVDGCELHFYSRPYLLHLRFPHPLVLDHDAVAATYDLDTGVAAVRLVKAAPGTHFHDLRCLSALLVTRVQHQNQNQSQETIAPMQQLLQLESRQDPLQPPEPPRVPGIQVVSSSSSACHGNESCSSPLPPSDLECPNDLLSGGCTEALESLALAKPRYGFAGRYEGVFAARAEDIEELVELPDPDHTPAWRRRQLRERAQANKFDPEHYIADFMMADDLEQSLQYAPQNSWGDRQPWSALDQDTLVSLPRREYLSDIDDPAAADLAGLLYASCYDLRCTAGERNCESAWTISRVCPSLSWLDPMPDPETAIRTAYARSLAYPLYRNVQLADAVLQDVKKLIEMNDVETLRSRLLRVLLDVKHVFEDTAMLRIFSDIFLTDYCIWIQHVSDGVLKDLARQLGVATVPIVSLPWDVRRLERYAVQLANGDPPDDDEPTWQWPHKQENSVAVERDRVDRSESFTECDSVGNEQSDIIKSDIRISALADDVGLRALSTRRIPRQGNKTDIGQQEKLPIGEGDSPETSSPDTSV
jgi:protein SHQ1